MKKLTWLTWSSSLQGSMVSQLAEAVAKVEDLGHDTCQSNKWLQIKLTRTIRLKSTIINHDFGCLVCFQIKLHQKSMKNIFTRIYKWKYNWNNYHHLSFKLLTRVWFVWILTLWSCRQERASAKTDASQGMLQRIGPELERRVCLGVQNHCFFLDVIYVLSNSSNFVTNYIYIYINTIVIWYINSCM